MFYIFITGNILTIVVLCSSQYLRKKPINRFLIHQSVIDLIACCVTIFEEMAAKLNLVYPVICQLFLSKICSVMMLYVSTYNMICMTIDRHFAITDPLHYDVHKVRRRLPAVFLFTWVFGIGVMLFVPITTVIQDGVCLPAHKLLGTDLWEYYYSPHSFIIALIIPLVIIIICYTRMYVALRYD